MGVQAFRLELAVERLDEAVVCRLAWPREVQGDVVGISPEVEVTGNELTAIVHPDRPGIPGPPADAFQCLDDVLASIGEPSVACRTVSRVRVDHGQDTQLIACRELVVNEAAGQASELSADDVLHLAVQCQIGDDSSVWNSHLPEPSIGASRRAATRILLAPIEIRRLADPCLPADLCHRHAVIALLQNERLLGVRKLDAFILPLLFPDGKFPRRTPLMDGPVFGDQSTSVFWNFLYEPKPGRTYCVDQFYFKWSRQPSDPMEHD